MYSILFITYKLNLLLVLICIANPSAVSLSSSVTKSTQLSHISKGCLHNLSVPPKMISNLRKAWCTSCVLIPCIVKVHICVSGFDLRNLNVIVHSLCNPICFVCHVLFMFVVLTWILLIWLSCLLSFPCNLSWTPCLLG